MADLINVHSYCAGSWLPSNNDRARPIHDATTGQQIGFAGGANFDTAAMLNHARSAGGSALRELTFHDRARALKALATHLNDNKEQLYELSYMTGATRGDSWIDIDGGIMTLFAYASRGRREMPDGKVYGDGQVEQLSRSGGSIGQHICTPKLGVGVHINAFNFPVWGMLEKLAVSLLAGVPAIVKPATDTCYVTEACFRLMVASNILPEGSFQLIAGSTGDLLDQLTAQDVVSFTGSAQTALMLRSNSNLLYHCVPFIGEQDSLNGTVLGPDATPGTPEFDLFAKEVVREMSTKAGQKCTAIRRIMVPKDHIKDCI